MGGDAENDGRLKGRTHRAAGSVKTRIESLVQPVPGHELADVRFERRTGLGPRSARALVVTVAVLVAVVGGGMLIGHFTGGSGDGGTVAAEGLSPTGTSGLLTENPLSRDDPSAGGTGSATASGDGGPGGTGGQGSDGTGEATVVVAVQGLVGSPGLHTVSAGTRLGEVLDLAGGAAPEAGLEGVNLAEKVVDGMQIVVDAGGSRVSYPGQAATGAGTAGTVGASGTTGEAGASSAAGAAAEGAVNINTADIAGLSTLPGIGEKTAQAIIAWRDANGPFTSPEQLMEVKGIGPAKYEALRDLVTV